MSAAQSEAALSDEILKEGGSSQEMQNQEAKDGGGDTDSCESGSGGSGQEEAGAEVEMTEEEKLK